MKLNLGSGNSKPEGFTNVDISANVGADVVHDLKQYPWPFENDSVDEILASHFVEHLDGIERMAFFNECWRIMNVGAKMLCVTPGAFTSRYMQDPTHKFPMVVWEFYNYLNEAGRKAALLEHYPLTCNFEFVGHHELNKITTPIAAEGINTFAELHLVNSVHDLRVTLTKLPRL